MEKIDNYFKESVINEKFELINDFLIEASKQPDKKCLNYIDFLIERGNKTVLEKTKLNLIYLLGEIGKDRKLEDKYLKFLNESYFNSDRWIRNEIIQAFNKLIDKNDFTEDIVSIFAYSLGEDYLPTKINSLNLIKKLDSLSDLILKNLLKILNNSNEKLVEKSIDILKIHIKDTQTLFNVLNSTENYKLLDKNSIRALLISYFDSIINLETFKKNIIKAKWIEKYKIMFCNEIGTYQKILGKRV